MEESERCDSVLGIVRWRDQDDFVCGSGHRADWVDGVFFA